MTTKPLTFEGGELVVNYATSVAGSIRFELQTADGKAIDGFLLPQSREMYGDEIERVVTWDNGSDVSALAGTPRTPPRPDEGRRPVFAYASGRPAGNQPSFPRIPAVLSTRTKMGNGSGRPRRMGRQRAGSKPAPTESAARHRVTQRSSRAGNAGLCKVSEGENPIPGRLNYSLPTIPPLLPPALRRARRAACWRRRSGRAGPTCPT